MFVVVKPWNKLVAGALLAGLLTGCSRSDGTFSLFPRGKKNETTATRLEQSNPANTNTASTKSNTGFTNTKTTVNPITGAIVTFDPAGTDAGGYNDLADQLTPWSTPDDRPESVSSNPTHDWLSLYGEVNGRGGSTEASGAIESISQISFATQGSDGEPDIDTTGQYVVYSSTQHHLTRDIYLKSVQGRTITQLTNDPGNDRMPSFSPDNSQIAFCSDRAGDYNIYIMDTLGSTAVQVTSDTAQEIHPTWSPDGRYLAFSRLGEGSGLWEIWVTEVGNFSSRQFIGYGLCPEWNPDPSSNRIVFQKARQRGSRLFSIWTIEIENGEGIRPTEIVSAANAAAISPSWSPDGKMITFTTIIEPGKPGWATPSGRQNGDIWIVNLDGTHKANLTNGNYLNVEPTWGADGSVYFISNRSGVDNIWSVVPDRTISTARGPDMIRDNESGGSSSGVAEVPTGP